MLTDKAREVFDAEYLRIFPQGGDISDHEEAVDSAVAAVVAWAQADQTRRIVEWLREDYGPGVRQMLADAIEAEFAPAPASNETEDA